MGLKAVRDLSKAYRHVDDVDLFSGGLLELPLEGAIVGPTFGCIIALQFRNLKRCDRFWYETPDKNVGFTPEQLRQIKNEKASAIFCRNADSPFPVQRFVFDLEDPESNPRLNCSTHFDVLPWRDERERRGQNFLIDSRPFCDMKGRILAVGSTVRVSACVECTCRTHDSVDESSCSTGAVGSCQNLIDEVGIEAVRVDPACRAQCPNVRP